MKWFTHIFWYSNILISQKLLPHTQKWLVKSFTLFSLPGDLAIQILATWVSLNYNIYKSIGKLANFKMSYLN